MEMFRKIAAILIGIMVALFTVIAILGIWDIIDVQHLFTKSIKTLAVLFISSAILMFVFSVLFKAPDEKN
jgi:xanthine/uracil permease